MSDAPLLGSINTVADLESATDFERKHLPHITLERTGEKVKVSVGVGHYVAHPNEPDHFIAWIEIIAGDAPIARFDLSPVATDPEVSVVLKVEPGSTLRAVEHCNLHGLWAAEVEA